MGVDEGFGVVGAGRVDDGHNLEVLEFLVEKGVEAVPDEASAVLDGDDDGDLGGLRGGHVGSSGTS